MLIHFFLNSCHLIILVPYAPQHLHSVIYAGYMLFIFYAVCYFPLLRYYQSWYSFCCLILNKQHIVTVAPCSKLLVFSFYSAIPSQKVSSTTDNSAAFTTTIICSSQCKQVMQCKLCSSQGWRAFPNQTLNLFLPKENNLQGHF